MSRTPQQIDAWKANAIQLARRYRARLERADGGGSADGTDGRAVAQGGGVCRQCIAADLCRWPAAYVDSIFEQAGWGSPGGAAAEPIDTVHRAAARPPFRCCRYDRASGKVRKGLHCVAVRQRRALSKSF